MIRSLSAVVLLALVCVSQARVYPYWAALCCKVSNKCPYKYAVASHAGCKPRTYMSAQPWSCRNAACNFCRRYRYSGACRSDSIRKNCFSGKGPGGPRSPVTRPPTTRPPTTRPSPPRPSGPVPSSGGPTCAVYGGSYGRVWIPATRFFKGSSYSRWTKEGNYIVWEKYRNIGRSVIDAKGTGSVCVRVKFPTAGHYYINMYSFAIHPTEHNDCWVKFSGGLNLYRPQSKSYKILGGYAAKDWYKAYQNEGKKGIANYGLTIDKDGHQFITKSLRSGSVHSFCISGRSDKFKIYGFAFIKCSPVAGCSRFSPGIKGALGRLPAPRCA